MKTLKRLTYLLLLVVIVSACNKDYDAPPLNEPHYSGADPNVTIKGIKDKFASVTSAAPLLIDESLIVKVLVGGNDVSGNIYKQLIVQDETGGISIGIDQSNMYSVYRVGQEVFLDLKGFSAVVYGGELQIGYSSTTANRIPWEIFKSQAHLNGWPDSTKVNPNIVAIKDLDVSMTNTVIQLDSVYFVNGGKTTFTTGDNTTSQTLMDKSGNSIDVRTSSYSKFAKKTLPTGVGSLIGELGRYNGSWQFTIRSEADIKNFSGKTPDGEKGTGTGTKEDPYDITNAIAKQGETDKWVKGYIVGSVPSTKIAEAEFVAPFTNNANVLIAASADETDPNKCFPIQLPYSATSTLRADVNLKDTPANKGREVIFKGNLTTYFGVSAMKETSEYVFTGGTPTPEPTPANDGSLEKPYTVSEFATLADGIGLWVEGYIVGCINGKALENAEFSAPFGAQTNIIIAASASESVVANCLPIALPYDGTLRADLGLSNKPELVGKKIKLKGDALKYFGVMGMKNTTDYEFSK